MVVTVSTGPARRAGRTAALVVSVVGTAAQAAAHLVVSTSHEHAGHAVGQGSDGRMVLAHLLAGVLTTAVLARRGAALRRLAQLLEGLLPGPRLLQAPPVLDLRTAASVAPAHDVVLVGRVLATARQRRGPPAGAPLRTAAA